MPALLLIRATGPKKGRVTSIFRADEDPGRLVRENVAGQWRFVIVQDAEPEDLQHLLAPELEDPDDLPEGVPPRMISARKTLIDLDTLPARGIQRADKFPARATDAGAYKLTRASLAIQESTVATPRGRRAVPFG